MWLNLKIADGWISLVEIEHEVIQKYFNLSCFGAALTVVGEYW